MFQPQFKVKRAQLSINQDRKLSEAIRETVKYLLDTTLKVPTLKISRTPEVLQQKLHLNIRIARYLVILQKI